MNLEGSSAERIASKEELSAVPDAFFDTMREASVQFAQNGHITSILLANTLISDPRFEPERFAASSWTEEQIGKTKRMMNAAHAARHVPVGTADAIGELKQKIEAVQGAGSTDALSLIVSDEHLMLGLNGQKHSALVVLMTLCGIEHPNRFQIHELSRRLTDEKIAEHVKSALHFFANFLRGSGGKELRQITKEMLDFKRSGLPQEGKELDDRKAVLRQTIHDTCEKMLADFRSQGGEISDQEAEMLTGYEPIG